MLARGREGANETKIALSVSAPGMVDSRRVALYQIVNVAFDKQGETCMVVFSTRDADPPTNGLR